MPYDDFLEGYSDIKKEAEENADFLVKKPSQIHGNGIFTIVKIRAGKEFYTVPMNDLRNAPSPGVARIAPGLFVSDKKVLNFVNHSCEANSIIVLGQNKIIIKSKREIVEGEEITLDYYLTEEKNHLIPCNCKSEKCRNFFFIS
jgi:hypothetical protein